MIFPIVVSSIVFLFHGLYPYNQDYWTVENVNKAYEIRRF